MTPSKITLQFYGVTLYLNLPPITIDDIPAPKTSQYISDPLPAAIYITSGNSVGMFTTPSDSPQLLVLYSDDTDTQHTTMRDSPFHISMEIGYCSKFRDDKICYKKSRFDCSVFSINKRVYYCHGPVIMGSQLRAYFIQNHHCMA